MNDFNTLFPTFSPVCLSLKSTLTPIAYLLITGGLIATILAGYQSGTVHFRALGRIIVFLMLLAYLPTWGNQVVSTVNDLVNNDLNVNAAQIHDQYEAALQLQKSTDGKKSWWEKTFDFPASMIEALMTVVFLVLGWLASAIEWWAYILQNAILLIGYALSPIFIGMLAFPSVEQVGRRYLMNLVGVMAWPLGWGVAGLVTQGVLNFMTDHSFISTPNLAGPFQYTYQNLMGLAFLGIWIIFSTIAAPVIIQKAIATGSSAASDLFGGAFSAGRSAVAAGMLNTAGFGRNRSQGNGAGGSSGGGGDGKRSMGAVIGGAMVAGTVGAMTAAETLVTSSINEGHGGSSLLGSLAMMNNRQSGQGGKKSQDGDKAAAKSSQASFPESDPSGDQTVSDLIHKSKSAAS
jgi:hypothetical protein